MDRVSGSREEAPGNGANSEPLSAPASRREVPCPRQGQSEFLKDSRSGNVKANFPAGLHLPGFFKPLTCNHLSSPAGDAAGTGLLLVLPERVQSPHQRRLRVQGPRALEQRPRGGSSRGK